MKLKDQDKGVNNPHKYMRQASQCKPSKVTKDTFETRGKSKSIIKINSERNGLNFRKHSNASPAQSQHVAMSHQSSVHRKSESYMSPKSSPGKLSKPGSGRKRSASKLKLKDELMQKGSGSSRFEIGSAAQQQEFITQNSATSIKKINEINEQIGGQVNTAQSQRAQKRNAPTSSSKILLANLRTEKLPPNNFIPSSLAQSRHVNRTPIHLQFTHDMGRSASELIQQQQRQQRHLSPESGQQQRLFSPDSHASYMGRTNLIQEMKKLKKQTMMNLQQHLDLVVKSGGSRPILKPDGIAELSSFDISEMKSNGGLGSPVAQEYIARGLSQLFSERAKEQNTQYFLKLNDGHKEKDSLSAQYNHLSGATAQGLRPPDGLSSSEDVLHDEELKNERPSLGGQARRRASGSRSISRAPDLEMSLMGQMQNTRSISGTHRTERSGQLDNDDGVGRSHKIFNNSQVGVKLYEVQTHDERRNENDFYDLQLDQYGAPETDANFIMSEQNNKLPEFVDSQIIITDQEQMRGNEKIGKMQLHRGFTPNGDISEYLNQNTQQLFQQNGSSEENKRQKDEQFEDTLTAKSKKDYPNNMNIKSSHSDSVQNHPEENNWDGSQRAQTPGPGTAVATSFTNAAQNAQTVEQNNASKLRFRDLTCKGPDQTSLNIADLDDDDESPTSVASAQNRMLELIRDRSLSSNRRKKRREKGKRGKDSAENRDCSLSSEAFQQMKTDKLINRLEEEQTISVIQLKNHIRQNHPKKNNEEWWPICSSPGAFFSFEEKREIPDFIRDIGLGASLYLLTLKALGKIFLALTILNLPAVYFYWSGTESNSRELTGVRKVFAQFSMGNMGEQRLQCGSVNFETGSRQAALSCHSGKLSRLVSFGLTKGVEPACAPARLEGDQEAYLQDGKIIRGADADYLDFQLGRDKPERKYIKNFMDFHPSCNTQTNEATLGSQFRQSLSSYFTENCKNYKSCTIPLDYKELNQECIEEVEKRFASRSNTAGRRGERRVPALQIVVICENSLLRLRGLDVEVHKKTIAAWIVFLDIISMAAILIFINTLIMMQQDFANQFDEETVEMRDFTVRSNQLPESFRQYEDEVSMKFAIWQQIQQKIKDAKESGVCDESIDPTIVEINLGINSFDVLNELKRIDDACAEIELLNIRLKKSTDRTTANKLKYKIARQRSLLHEKVESFKKKCPEDSLMKNIQNKVQSESKSSGHPSISGDGSLDKPPGRSQAFHQIMNVHITFLSMETRDLVLEKLLTYDARLPSKLRKFYQEKEKEKKLTEGQEDKNDLKKNLMGKLFQNVAKKVGQQEETANGSGQRPVEDKKDKPITLQFSDVADLESAGASTNTKKDPKPNPLQNTLQQQLQRQLTIKVEKELERVNEQLKLEPPVDPEYILWDNVGFTDESRNVRRCFSVLIASLIILCSVCLVIAFKGKEDEILKKQVDCGTISISKQMALQDQQLHLSTTNRTNDDSCESNNTCQLTISPDMSCYCQEQYANNFGSFLDLDFNDLENGLQNHPNYCKKWLKEYIKDQLIILASSLVVVGINLVAQEIFVLTAQYEKQPSTALENKSIFELIFYQQFVNIGIILVVADTRFRRVGDFGAEWYISIGSSLCLTMVAQTFSTKGSDMFRIFCHLLYRYYDRGFKMEIRKDDTTDIANTRQVRQVDLQEIYTGSQIRIGYKFAQTFTFIFVCLAYSSGLPIMYPIGTVYFVMTYWFDKVCLMRYYQKTKVFNEELPIQSVELFKYAVFLHFVFAGIMFQSSSLLSSKEIEGEDFQQISYTEDATSKWLATHVLIFLIFVLICAGLYVYQYFFANPIAVLLHKWIKFKKDRKKMGRAWGKLGSVLTVKKSQGSLVKLLAAKADEENKVGSKQSSPRKTSPVYTKSSTVLVKPNLDANTLAVPMFRQHTQMVSDRETSLTNRGGESSKDRMVDVMTGKVITKKLPMNLVTGQSQKVVSNNFYGELLFDYLETYYDNHKQYLAEVYKKYTDMKHEQKSKKEMLFNTANLDARIEAFKDYINEIELNKKLIEDQIEFYDRVIQKEIYNHEYHGHNKNESCGTASISAQSHLSKLEQIQHEIKQKESQENPLQRQSRDYNAAHRLDIKKKNKERGDGSSSNSSRDGQGQIQMMSLENLDQNQIIDGEGTISGMLPQLLDHSDQTIGSNNFNVGAHFPGVGILKRASIDSGQKTLTQINEMPNDSSNPSGFSKNSKQSKQKSLSGNSKKYSSFVSQSFNSSGLNVDEDALIQKLAVRATFLNKREKLFMRKLDNLNDNFDEHDLRYHYFPGHLRCASFSQTYNIMDNPQFNQADFALERAELLLQNPIIYEEFRNGYIGPGLS